MIKKLLFLIAISFAFNIADAQENYWSNVNENNLKVDQQDVIEYDMVLNSASYFQLDKEALSNQLNAAPYRNEATSSNVELSIPLGNNKFEIYEMFKVRTLSPQLALNYPDIQSYVGRIKGKKDASIVRITITPQGFYAMMKKPDVGQIFINPYDRNADYYVSFYKSNALDVTKLHCEVDYSNDLLEDDPEDVLSDSDYQSLIVDDGTLRTYNLALAGTGEYSQFHISQAGLGGATTTEQIAAVLAAMVVTMDRVNSIYEIDLGVTFQLIPNNDQIIYLDASSDPYTGNSAGAMINENQSNLDIVIGSGNYDIGHVFSTGGAGLAGFESSCKNGLKARGVTGISSPVGDSFDVDYVSHEFGHQLGADHTQNNNCQRNSATAMETGSGSTIMGYAGICPPNVQNNSDANFHQISINQIFSYISSGVGSLCGNFASQANNAPNLNPLPTNYTIPYGTPFYLDVVATDLEGDPLTYNWEQLDNEISIQPPSPGASIGPNFRALPSSSDSRRYFPRFEEVLANNLAPTWEVIPFTSRTMDFVVTVRDNNINVGQSSRDLTTVNFANVGPFQVTSQNTDNIDWLPGETRTITWNVAGTTANGINTNNVNILLSTDGGITFDTILASGTPNDGSHDITVPNVSASFCRIMVEADGNIFYALNSNPFAIGTACNSYPNNTTFLIPDGEGTTAPDQGTPVFSTITIPDDIQNISDISIHLNATHDGVSELIFQLQGSGEFTNLWIGNCSGSATIDVTFNDNGATLPAPSSCGNPITGIYASADTNTPIADIFSGGTQGSFSLAGVDFFSGNTGTINSWEIEICSTTFSVEDNQTNGFSISPNPNNGVFNVNFDQAIAPESKMSLYDIQGRLIENLDFDPNQISQTIRINSPVQSGIYLLEVANEQGRFVNKLIIR